MLLCIMQLCQLSVMQINHYTVFKNNGKILIQTLRAKQAT